MDQQTKENWAVAGLISGEAFADEYMKMAGVFLLQQHLDENGFDKEAAGLARRALKAVTSIPGLRRVGIPVATAAAGGAGGAFLGKKEEQEKAMAQMQAMAPRIYRHGFIIGARQGFARGAKAGFMHAKGERTTG
jgi:hypothetical protein